MHIWCFLKVSSSRPSHWNPRLTRLLDIVFLFLLSVTQLVHTSSRAFVGWLATAHSVHSLKNCTVPSGAAGPRCFTQEPWPAVSSQISSVTLCLPRGSLLDQAGARFLISTSPPGFPPSILLSLLLYWFCLRPFCQ